MSTKEMKDKYEKIEKGRAGYKAIIVYIKDSDHERLKDKNINVSALVRDSISNYLSLGNDLPDSRIVEKYYPSRREFLAAASLTGMLADRENKKWYGEELELEAIKCADKIIAELSKSDPTATAIESELQLVKDDLKSLIRQIDTNYYDPEELAIELRAKCGWDK